MSKIKLHKYVDCPICEANSDVTVNLQYDPKNPNMWNIYCGHCGSLSGFEVNEKTNEVRVYNKKTNNYSIVGELQ
jgi:transcription elongation factor Elf1